MRSPSRYRHSKEAAKMNGRQRQLLSFTMWSKTTRLRPLTTHKTGHGGGDGASQDGWKKGLSKEERTGAHIWGLGGERRCQCHTAERVRHGKGAVVSAVCAAPQQGVHTHDDYGQTWMTFETEAGIRFTEVLETPLSIATVHRVICNQSKQAN